ncbi:MAG: hypothetical protein ABIY50_08380 [Ignavibacteria bacterium]
MEKSLEELIEEYFQNSEYSVIEFIQRGDGGTKVAEIFVDNEKGINIDELAKINRDLNDLVDTELIIKDLSKLVVSSPGAERPFRFFWQLKKHNGRTLELELNNGEKLEGKLLESDENDHVTIDIIKKEKNKKISAETRIINFSEIKESKVKLSFSK